MMNRSGWLLLTAAFVISLNDVFSSRQHEEQSEDADFRREFGDDDVTSESVFSSSHNQDDILDENVEVREPASFARQQPSPATDLPPLRFLYCVSCGYRQAFDQFTQVVREKYPLMPTEGANYPPAQWKAYLSNFVSFAKMGVFVSVIGGMDPFASIGWATPTVLQWAHANKISACMMTFLVSNMVEGSLMSTGAFEIYLGETLLWSKLESGRVPAPAELMQMIDTQLELTGKIPKMSVAGGASGFGSFEQQ